MVDILNKSKSSLIVARNLSLHVPISASKEKILISQPFRLLHNYYFSRARRTKAILLNKISFKLQSGERLGLIGSNGAGKSTLLRVLAGIYRRSSGNLLVNGPAKGLFDISLGMHLDGTGLENIYMRGLRMGLKPKKVRSLIPEVMTFSELNEHINKPVATYSAGMRLRLAIAMSIMIEPDILLLDEWIGAGDAYFNAKVKKRMLSMVKNSHGLVLASHNTSLMKSICTHGLVLDKGSVIFYGKVKEALAYYNKNLNQTVKS